MFTKFPTKCLQDIFRVDRAGNSLSKPAQLSCFRTVLVGEGGLDVFYSNLPTTRRNEAPTSFVTFRGRIQRFASTHFSSTKENKRHQPLVVILQKHGRRSPTNYPEIIETMSSLDVQVEILTEQHNLTHTVIMIQRAAILITPAGGLTAFAMFLPKGSSVIIFAIPFEDQTTGQTKVWDYDTPALSRFNYFSVRHYPVWVDDIVAAHNATCASYNGSKDHVDTIGQYVFCSYRVDVSRLRGIVLDELSLQHHFREF